MNDFISENKQIGKQNDENYNFFHPKLQFLYNEMGQPINFQELIISIWRFPNPMFFGQ